MQAREMQKGRTYVIPVEGVADHSHVEVEAVEIDADGVLVTGYWGTATERLAYGTGYFEKNDPVTDITGAST